MGMFDDVIFLDPTGSRDIPTCPAGHTVKDLQTKDFDCSMSQYYIRSGFLYKSDRDAERNEEFQLIDSTLVVKNAVRAPREDYTGEVFAYSSCGVCRPILFLSNRDSVSVNWGDAVLERFPRQGFRIKFEHGKLIEIKSECQTREDVREILIKDDLVRDLLLEDTDRVAIRHFAAKDREKLKK